MNQNILPSFALPDWVSPELFDEIAGILEYDNRMSRLEAESMALKIIYKITFGCDDKLQ